MQARGQLIASLLLAIAGCDGHFRTLYLRPPETAKPPWSVASVVIPIGGHEDVMRIVSAVAADLGLTRDTDFQDWNAAWSVKHRGDPRMTFTLAVNREDAGYWTVRLLDYPTTTRSTYSVDAERAIRESLKRASTPASGRGSAAG